MFSRLFRRIPAPATASRPTPPRHRARPKLVELEDRSVPTTFTWQGVTGDSWSLGTNWDQGTAPTTGADVVIDNGTTPAYNTTVEINTLTVGSTSGLSVAGGALTVDADSTWNGGVTIAGGTVHVGDVVADVVHASNVTLSSGTLEGPGSLIASGLFTWTGGNMDVPFDGNGNPAGGQTITNGSLAITANGQSIRGRTLTVNGGATLTGAGTITGNTGAVFNVNSLFNIQSDADFSWGFGTIPVMAISATGTLRKSGGDGDTFSLFAVNNNGAVEVKSGNLLLQNGGASTGHFEVDANHILVFSQSSGGNTDLNSGAASRARALCSCRSASSISRRGAPTVPRTPSSTASATAPRPSSTTTPRQAR